MNIKTSLLLLGIALSLSACTNTQVANNESLNQEAMKQAHQTEVSPEEAVLAAAKKVLKASDDGLHFYAPLHMKKAKNKLKEAQKLKKKMAAPEDKVAVISAAFAVDLLIKNAYKNQVVVEQQLVKSLEHKMVLEKLGADTVMPKAYAKGIKKLRGLIKEIEGGMLSKALKEEAGVLKYFAKIEAETLKIQYLSRAESMMKKAKGADANELAEKTFKAAEMKFKLANAFIKKNYRDREGVIQVSDDAYNAAASAYHVAIEVKKILEVKEKKAEEYILFVESLLQRINSGSQVKNLTSMSFYDQSLALAEALEKGDSLEPESRIAEEPAAEDPNAEALSAKSMGEEEMGEDKMSGEYLSEEVLSGEVVSGEASAEGGVGETEITSEESEQLPDSDSPGVTDAALTDSEVGMPTMVNSESNEETTIAADQPSIIPQW